jgi:murein DD-endopeptidase MepM/ murein hydrolase activator NlpD
MAYVLERAGRAYQALGNADIPTLPPEYGKPQPPIYPLIQGSHGGYLEARNSPADGSCGVGSYPCKHPGLDVFGMAGTPVVAPEDSTVIAAADGSSSPFGGYGPWIILLEGVSGKTHLLGHLDPAHQDMAPVGQSFQGGDQVGTTSGANHTHWEVRDVPIPDYAHGQTGFDIIMDPVDWLAEATVTSGSIGSIILLGGAAALLWFLWRR